MRISEGDVEKLKANPSNPNVHSRQQIKKLVRQIQKHGFIGAVVVDENFVILAGHGRWEAAKAAGLKTVPVVQVTHLSEAQKQAFMLADNRIARDATWDRAKLFEIIQELSGQDIDLDLTGFDAVEIDKIVVEGVEAAGNDQDSEPPVPPAQTGKPPVTALGDAWKLGEHGLLCGDALKRADFLRLLAKERAAIVFTDPPYNVKIDGHVSGLGRVKHREFAQASGEMSEAEFTGFLAVSFKLLAEFSQAGSIHYVCMDWRHSPELLSAAKGVYSEYKNLCVWVKPNGGMGTFYRSRHELVHVFKNGTAPHTNNFELGQSGRYRTNVWEYRGVNSHGNNRMEELEMHPTVKPVLMIADAIKDCSKPGEIILDPFGGSGSTLMAAERTGRKARLIEIDPLYCDVIIRRWQAYTGKAAVNLDTGLTFEQTEFPELNRKRKKFRNGK
ncbi:MAG: ParB N-terminal domain-containing protein [Xanthobacteraceae bacterium]|nr:ParB N-terminal domain-containing protein [Xanthobacteraceae bacterium]